MLVVTNPISQAKLPLKTYVFLHTPCFLVPHDFSTSLFKFSKCFKLIITPEQKLLRFCTEKAYLIQKKKTDGYIRWKCNVALRI